MCGFYNFLSIYVDIDHAQLKLLRFFYSYTVILINNDIRSDLKKLPKTKYDKLQSTRWLYPVYKIHFTSQHSKLKNFKISNTNWRYPCLFWKHGYTHTWDFSNNKTQPWITLMTLPYSRMPPRPLYDYKISYFSWRFNFKYLERIYPNNNRK